MSETVLSVNDLKTYFYTRQGIYKSVDGVSFDLKKGETLGIVGESGSGKSVTVMSLLGLIPQPPGKIEGGSAMFEGVDLLKLKQNDLRKIRGNKISMIFQDPMTSLNPYLKISTQLTETLIEHDKVDYDTAYRRAVEVMKQVGIPAAEKRIHAYPHQFSGGMRQRVMIAMAIINEPQILIADEPTTALDVTVQAQILDLLKDLQKKNGMSLVVITHDLGVVAGVSDHVLVMYAGRAVEQGSSDEIFYEPKHPYTQGLLKSIPKITGIKEPLYSIEGLPPDPSRLPVGCAFSPRCEFAQEACRNGTLPVQTFSESHESVCIRGEGV